LPGLAHVPSERKKFVVPPPLDGVRPASEDENKGSVTSAPVLLVSSRVAAV
jgi:hypothetical protein